MLIQGSMVTPTFSVFMIVFVCVFVSGVFATRAYAGIQSYCELFGKDFADGKSSDADTWQINYRNAFTDCITQYTANATVNTPHKKVVRKVAVVPANAFAKKKRTRILEPGSNPWSEYCAAKYASFNKVTGNYKSKTGKELRCRVTSD